MPIFNLGFWKRIFLWRRRRLSKIINIFLFRNIFQIYSRYSVRYVTQPISIYRKIRVEAISFELAKSCYSNKWLHMESCAKHNHSSFYSINDNYFTISKPWFGNFDFEQPVHGLLN